MDCIASWETVLAGKVLAGEMSLVAALQEAAKGAKTSDAHLLWTKYGGKNVFIRTVTHHYTGRMSCLADGFIHLEDSAWIADDGRFNECLATGKLNEVEPYPFGCCVAIGAIVDICAWQHTLPRSVK